MLTFFLKTEIFNANWYPLNILRSTLFGNSSEHHDSHGSSLIQSFNNDKDLLMKTRNVDPKENKLLQCGSPKVILQRLNINEADNLLILNNKIYIEQKDMTGQSKSMRKDLVVKGRKTYEEYNGSITTLTEPVERSYKKPKTQIKLYFNSAHNDSLNSSSRPLRQINGNASPKSANFLSNSESKTKLNATETTSFQLPDQSLYDDDREQQSPHIQEQKRKARNGKLTPSVLIKPLKRLSSGLNSSFFSILKNGFSLRNEHASNHSHSNTISRSNIPFHNWYNNSRLRRNDFIRTKRIDLINPRKIPFVSQRSKGSQTSCTVTLERIDAKICFMDYLKLKPTVKTDVCKMHELSLLRRYNIRGCQVVISRQPVELERKTRLANL